MRQYGIFLSLESSCLRQGVTQRILRNVGTTLSLSLSLSLPAILSRLFQRSHIGDIIVPFFSATLVQNIIRSYKYSVIILSDNCKLPLPVGSFTVLT